MNETLKQIAALVATLEHGPYPSLALGTDSRAAVNALAAVPGAEQHTNVYEHGTHYAIDVATAQLDALTVSATCKRAATPEEIAALDRPDACTHKLVPMRSAHVKAV